MESQTSGGGGLSEPSREGVQLRRYQCHKVVSAAKILEIRPAGVDDPQHPSLILEVAYQGGAVLQWIHDDLWCAQRSMGLEWMEKHDPQVGGYFVVYEGGYESYSPAKVFETGYTKVRHPGGDLATKCSGCFKKMTPEDDRFAFVIPTGTLPMGGGERLAGPLVMSFCTACNDQADTSMRYFEAQVGEGVKNMNRFALQQYVDGKQVFEDKKSGTVSYVKDDQAQES